MPAPPAAGHGRGRGPESGRGEIDRGFGPQSEVVLHALVAAGLLDDQPGTDRIQVGIDLIGVEAETEAWPWRRGLPLPAAPEGDWLADASRCRSPLTGQLVENLDVITGQQRDLYHQLSSAELTGHVEAHLGLLTALLGGNAPDRLQHRVASAAAEAAGFAAWLWHDRQEPARAARLYKLADDAAREAGDRRLASYLAGYQGLARTHDLASATAWLAGAVEGAPRSLSGVAASWLSALHAEAAARSGDQRAAKSSLSQATEQLSGCRAGQKQAWMYDFDEGGLAMRAGSCHVALGDHRLAVAAFRDALMLLPPGHERRRAEIHLGLAYTRPSRPSRRRAGIVERQQRPYGLHRARVGRRDPPGPRLPP